MLRADTLSALSRIASGVHSNESGKSNLVVVL